MSPLCLFCASALHSVHVGRCINLHVCTYYRDRIEGPQSIIKRQRQSPWERLQQELYGEKKRGGRRREKQKKRKRKLTFKNRERQRNSER